jgi:hypothetical protein
MWDLNSNVLVTRAIEIMLPSMGRYLLRRDYLKNNYTQFS